MSQAQANAREALRKRYLTRLTSKPETSRTLTKITDTTTFHSKWERGVFILGRTDECWRLLGVSLTHTEHMDLYKIALVDGGSKYFTCLTLIKPTTPMFEREQIFAKSQLVNGACQEYNIERSAFRRYIQERTFESVFTTMLTISPPNRYQFYVDNPGTPLCPEDIKHGTATETIFPSGDNSHRTPAMLAKREREPEHYADQSSSEEEEDSGVPPTPEVKKKPTYGLFGRGI